MEYFDLFISIGPACRPAYHLKQNFLRLSSSPLDWQMNYSLETVINLFSTNFKDFFVHIKEAQESGAENNRKIIDKKNNIISIHHFSNDLALEDAQIAFLNTMQKRFNDINTKLKKINKVAFVSNRNEKIEDFVQFLQQFKKLYSHLEIQLINIRNDESLDNNTIQKSLFSIFQGLSIVEYRINDSVNRMTGMNFDWKGNTECWNLILKEYRLSSENSYLINELQSIQKNNSVVIYGAGETCRSTLKILQRHDIKVTGIAVTDITKHPTNIGNIPIRTIDEYYKTSYIVVAIFDDLESEKVIDQLKSTGYKKIISYHELLNISSLV